MTSNKPSSFKRPVKILVLTVAVLALAVFALHLWFIHNARGYLQDIIASKSHGKLKLDLAQVSFDFFTNKIQLRGADLVSTDSINQPLSYHIRFRKLTLRIHSFWPMIFQKKLLLDSIKLHDPDIEVLQWRRDTLTVSNKNNLSLPQQMGQLYNSMLDALEVFGIRRIIINNARLSLINKMDSTFKPVVISKINFDLIREENTGKKRDAFIANEQNVELTTSDQHIFLPSGRHILSFKTFKLQLFKKRVELDSCTVTAVATNHSKSSYNIFFNKLSLVGVDFNAMYRYNLIKADSVYCENPFFDINLDPGKKPSDSAKKEKPDLDKLVRELTGDLDLAFVGVKDAGIHIDMIGAKKRSLFNSNKDNFEMRGFRINADSSKPVVVKQFDMLVRDYHLYNVDSSTAYTFDSIRFLNNKIVLNNFIVTTEPSRTKARSERNFKIPYFELTGLDWFELIFEQNLRAEEAALYNPIIYYKKNPHLKKAKKTNFFASLQTLDDIMTLNKIKIINGQLNMQMGPSASFVVEDLNLSLYSNSLMKSTNKEGLRRAVEFLSFTKGQIRLKDITAKLQNIRFTGDNLLHCDELNINSKSNMINGSMHSVDLNNMLVDDENQTILLDGLQWAKATLSIHSKPAGTTSKKNGNITLKNISGKNTSLKFTDGKIEVSTFFNQLKMASLVKNGKAPIAVNGLFVNGNQLGIQQPGLLLKTASYSIADDAPSYLNGVEIQSISKRDSLSFTSPRINFSADVNAIMNKDFHLSSVDAVSPVINMRKWNATPSAPDGKTRPIVRIDRILTTEPLISVELHKSDSVTTINIPKGKGSVVKATGLKMENGSVVLEGLSLKTSSATFVKSTGEIYGVEQGNIDLDISNIHLSQKEGKPFWSAQINNLLVEHPNSLVIGKGKSKLSLEQVAVGNINLSSEYASNFSRLLRSNVSAWLKSATGEYTDSNTSLKWYNAGYNSAAKLFKMDSFTYHPTKSRDSLVAQSSHQIDYITFHSGAITMSDFSLEKYQKDSTLTAETIEIYNPLITVYRDKKPPFLSGIIKPLPVDMIKKIPFPVGVRKLHVLDGTLLYTERHPKTRAEGTLSLNHLNLHLHNIKNQNITSKDSFVLKANTYLMDSALVHLAVSESYKDSLSGFLMTMRMRPTSLSFLNPVLAPLSNVVITSGTIDSFHLRAIGRDNIALGEMQMYYHNLHIKLIKGGDLNKTSFFTKILTSLVNTLLVKKNNNGRTGLVYFERLRDRSFFNYIVKIAFSGLATSIGVKKNSRYMKKYKRELQNNKLPPIEF